MRFCTLDLLSIIVRPWRKTSCRTADHDISATQRAPSRQNPKYPRLWRVAPVLRRCALRRVHKSVPLTRLRLRTERVTKVKARVTAQRAPARSANSVPLTRLLLRTERIKKARARAAARRELPVRCRREVSVLAVWPIYIPVAELYQYTVQDTDIPVVLDLIRRSYLFDWYQVRQVSVMLFGFSFSFALIYCLIIQQSSHCYYCW